MKGVVVVSQPSIDIVDRSERADAAALYTGFDGYVRERAQALSRFAFLLTGDCHLAEDLVQTALAKVAVRWHRVAAEGDPTPYVRTVLVHTAISWRRRLWRVEVPTAPLPEQATFDEGATIDNREQLRHALSQVPPRQRAALVLRFYEDLSEAEIAAAMGCSVGTVKSQTAKGLARLRTVLAVASITATPPGEDQ